jgi:hypothetical protein
VWSPLWGRENRQEKGVGFFSPKHEAYRPFGKLAAVKPLLSTISQRFPSNFRSFSQVLSPTDSQIPQISLKPESRHSPRKVFLREKYRYAETTQGKR